MTEYTLLDGGALVLDTQELTAIRFKVGSNFWTIQTGQNEPTIKVTEPTNGNVLFEGSIAMLVFKLDEGIKLMLDNLGQLAAEAEATSEIKN